MKIKLFLLSFVMFSGCLAQGQLKFEDLTIDTTITGFHYAADFQGTKVFTKNGPSDIQTINPTAFSFTVAEGLTSIIAKSELSKLLARSKQNGYKISNLVEKDTTINGNPAYYISYTERDDKLKYKNVVFNAFVIKQNTLVLFTGGDLDNGQFIDKFKKTFFSLKL